MSLREFLRLGRQQHIQYPFIPLRFLRQMWYSIQNQQTIHPRHQIQIPPPRRIQIPCANPSKYTKINGSKALFPPSSRPTSPRRQQIQTNRPRNRTKVLLHKHHHNPPRTRPTPPRLKHRLRQNRNNPKLRPRNHAKPPKIQRPNLPRKNLHLKIPPQTIRKIKRPCLQMRKMSYKNSHLHKLKRSSRIQIQPLIHPIHNNRNQTPLRNPKPETRPRLHNLQASIPPKRKFPSNRKSNRTKRNKNPKILQIPNRNPYPKRPKPQRIRLLIRQYGIQIRIQ